MTMMTIFGFHFILQQRHENLNISYNIAAGALAYKRSRRLKIIIGMGLGSLHDEEGRAN